MCGIYGFTGPPDAASLAALRLALRPRGPDGTGEAVRGAASLGCQRLAIVSPSDGAQPLVSEDGRFTLVCNGEIYNHRQLRRELAARGHRFASGSDCEVALHAFEDEGPAALSRLAGMFALALWDEQRQRLLVARDSSGMKPLATMRHQGRWWFASEAKALLLASTLPRQVNLGALDGLLRLGFVPGRGSLFAGIERLPAGHWLELSESAEPPAPAAPQPFPPHRPAPAFRQPPPDGWAAELRRRLGRAVDSHLAADVPVGVSLSGGLDSSLLAALAAERAGAGIKTFSIGVPGGQDERPYARAVAERFRTDHCEMTVRGEDLWERLPRVVWNAEEPRTGPLVLNDLLFERARRDVGALLLGEGADELFGGYLRFKSALPPLGFLPGRLAAGLYGTRKLGAAAGDLYGSLLLAARRTHGDPLMTWLGPALHRHGTARLAGLLGYEQHIQLPNAHLPRVDLLSMAHALEVRLPFLDSGLVDLAAQIPLRLKVGWRSEKMVLRQAATGLLPPAILARRKQGQANPLRLWESAGLLDRAADLLSPAALAARRLFTPRAVGRLLARLRRGRGLPFDSNRLHLLVLIEIWHRLYIDPDRLAPPP